MAETARCLKRLFLLTACETKSMKMIENGSFRFRFNAAHGISTFKFHLVLFHELGPQKRPANGRAALRYERDSEQFKQETLSGKEFLR